MRPLRPAAAVLPPAAAPPSATGVCSNCGGAAGAYCAACGRGQRDFHRSVRTFAHELFGEFSGWDGKIPGTLRLLLTRPGALTREFLAGRRVRYLSPLRLYFLASVALFFALRTPIPWKPMPVHVDYAVPSSAAAADGSHPRDVGLWLGTVRLGVKGDLRYQGSLNDPSWRARVGRGINARMQETFARPAAAASAEVEQSFVAHLGTTLLLLVPLLALFSKLLWRRARLFFAEHMVYSLHVNAQAFVAFTLARFAPGLLWLAAVAWTAAYLWMSARRVYGVGHESRAATTVKVVALGGGYALALALGMLVTFIISFFFRG